MPNKRKQGAKKSKRRGEERNQKKKVKGAVKLYTQTKKTTNTENIPGMCVLTNHMRDLVTAENEWVSGHRIELVLNCFEKPEG